MLIFKVIQNYLGVNSFHAVSAWFYGETAWNLNANTTNQKINSLFDFQNLNADYKKSKIKQYKLTPSPLSSSDPPAAGKQGGCS